MTGECPAHRALTRRRLPHPRGPTLLHFFEAQNTQIGLVFFPSINFDFYENEGLRGYL